MKSPRDFIQTTLRVNRDIELGMCGQAEMSTVLIQLSGFRRQFLSLLPLGNELPGHFLTCLRVLELAATLGYFEARTTEFHFLPVGVVPDSTALEVHKLGCWLRLDW